MKCPFHLTKEVAGYCVVCGSFRCDECLTQHKDDWYCAKHYKPIQEQLDREEKTQAARKTAARNAIEVHYLDDRVEKGLCFALNPKEAEFHIERVDDSGAKTGHISHVRFGEIKYVRNVRRYDPRGAMDGRAQFNADQGEDLVIEYPDGELLHVRTLRPQAHNEPRFYALLERNGKYEPVITLIDKGAGVFVGSPDAHDARRRETRQEQKEELKASGPVSQEESMGDFYFGNHEYDDAIGQYKEAIKKQGKSARLKKKLIVATYNAGMHHVRHHRYPQALEYMDAVLLEDPNNSHAKEKARALQKRIDKTKRMMEQFTQHGASSFAKESKKEQ